MAPKIKYEINSGDTFGRWITTGKFEKRGKNKYFECICSCGTIKYVSKYSLVKGKSISCGCHRKEYLSKLYTTHGLSNKSIYHSYKDMIKRCLDQNNSQWNHYGGKGITVCERWKESFENFSEDMYKTWFEGATIERIDSLGDYEPSNTTWVTQKQQNRNTGMRSSNKTGVKGVFKSNNGYYKATWSELDGSQKAKAFSIKKYGDEIAFKLACEYRASVIERLNKEGAGYSEYHIGEIPLDN